MSSKSIVDQIRHYQKDIERCPENSERMIRCIQRLYVLPILVQHLQETGVGRSVNALRKYNGEVGEAAKALVTKWKAMVAAEESDDGGNAPLKESSDNNINPPSSQVKTENGKEEKAAKHESSRHSGHKRSHSISAKPEKKSSYSADRDKKSSSDRVEKSKREPKHEKEQIKEEKHSKHSSSKESRKSREITEDESDHSPSRKKRKKNCVKEKRRKEMEDSDKSSEEESDHESSYPAQPDPSDDDDHSGPQESDDEQEAANTSAKETSSDENSSDQKHTKDKKRSSDHHKSKSSSHSSHSKHTEKSYHKDEKRDSHKSSHSSKDIKKLIKENEKRIKKEKFERAYDSGGSTPKGSSSPTKSKEKSTVKVKEESNNDGIDAGSGFSFGDALAGLDSAPKKKKKATKDDSVPKSSSSSSGQKSSSSSHSHKSSKPSSSKDHSSSSSSKDRLSSSTSSSAKKDKYSDTAMPELLKKPIKMENLELDINSTLPEINPNYRPLPHVPENARRNSTKSIANEEDMFNMMMNKNQRTKVFSGGKSSYNTHVPSLYDLCIKLLYDNIDGLEFTGGVPYDLLKPLLDKLNPDQLFILEHYNPYLIEDTGPLWEFHSKKDFRNQKRQDMESWRELYVRCMEEREEKLKNLTQNISQSIAASTPVRKAKLAYVDSAVKPPRHIAKKQARYGTGDASPIMKAHAAEKRMILNKAVVGGHDPSSATTVTVPPPPQSSAPRSSWSAPVAVAPNKKRKAPLMAKALQLIKGTNRFKR